MTLRNFKNRNLHDSDSIVVEDCRNIFRREFVCRVADQQARLTDGTVTDNNAPRIRKGIKLANLRISILFHERSGNTNFIVATTIVASWFS